MTPPNIVALVPELSCSDFKQSLNFYTSVLGFELLFERPERGFAFVALGQAQIMLEQSNGNWDTGSLQQPYGRGINFQIVVPDLQPLIEQSYCIRDPAVSGPRNSVVPHRHGRTGRDRVFGTRSGRLSASVQPVDWR